MTANNSKPGEFLKKDALACIALAAAFLALAVQMLLRPLWFDEALTVLNFALLESAKDIYLNYAIPNNHILYTIALHFHMMLDYGLPVEAHLRLPSVIAAIITICVLYRDSRLACGRMAAAAAVAGLALSRPFVIYATAIRGYMFCMMFSSIALYAIRRIDAGRGYRHLAIWFIASGAAVACMPSAAIAVAAMWLYAVIGRRTGVAIAMASSIAALLAFALFYGPIAGQLVACSKLNEGISSRLVTFESVAVLFALGLGWTLLPVSVSLFKSGWRERCSALAPLAVIACAILAMRCPPFPRIFLPVSVLCVPVAAECVERLLHDMGPRQARTVFLAGIFSTAVLAFAAPAYSPVISSLCGGADSDDFAMPKYLRDDFKPREAARMVASCGSGRGVYCTFDSDPWTLAFYLQCQGADIGRFMFDGPRGGPAELESGTIVVTAGDYDAARVRARFGVGMREVGRAGRNVIYAVMQDVSVRTF